MAERTNIEWADASWNPWHGCIKVSPGCRFCYMYREKKIYGQDPTAILRSKTTFKDPLKWQRRWKRAVQTLRNAHFYLSQMEGMNTVELVTANFCAQEILNDLANAVSEDPQPRFIFTCSWSDFFITEADAWRAEAWEIIRQTPEFTYLILTKRPDRIARCLPADWGDGYPNVWLGTSIENPKYLSRITELQKVPSAKKFLSLEPLLDGLDIRDFLMHWSCDYCGTKHYHHSLDLEEKVCRCGKGKGSWGVENGAPAKRIHWIIVGGESGNVARPMEKQWALDLRDQCEAAGVDFFFKQWGEWAPQDAIADSVNLALKTYDSKRELYKVGAEAAGNLLDGKHHLARPEPVTAEIAAKAEVTA